MLGRRARSGAKRARVVGALCLLFGGGCGDDGAAADAGPARDGGPPDAARPDAGAPDAGSPAGSVTLEVVRDGEPVAGAVASFDPPTGGRVDGVTDAAGRARFEGVDWSGGGSARVTAFAGTTAYGLVGFTEADLAAQPEPGVVRVELSMGVSGGGPPETDDWVDLTVSFQNRVAPASSFSVATVTRGLMVGAEPGMTSMRVPPGEPLSLVAYEHGAFMRTARGGRMGVFAWAHAEAPAPAAATSVDVDFAESVEPTRVSGSIALPAGFVAGASYRYELLRVLRPDFIGIPADAFVTRHEFDARAENVEYDVEYALRPGEGPEIYVTRWQVTSDEGRHHTSTALVAGLPGDGPQDVELLAIPAVRAPAEGSAQPLHDPIELEVAEGVSEIELLIVAVGGSFSWLVRVGSDHGSLRLPRLPTGVDEARVIDAAELGGMVLLCDRDGALLDEPCGRSASLRGLQFMR